jgi:hypothetical protein
MPTPAWPNTLPDFTLSYPEEWDDPTIRSEMEGGYTITRQRYTRFRRKFKRGWAALEATDYATLIAFYQGDAAGGSAFFTWTTDTDATSVNVRFSAPLKAEMIVPARGSRAALYRVEVELAEV